MMTLPLSGAWEINLGWLFLSLDSRNAAFGRVAEWFKAAVLKTAVGSRPPWVRIPPRPGSPVNAFRTPSLDVGQKNFGNDQPASWTGSGVHDPFV